MRETTLERCKKALPTIKYGTIDLTKCEVNISYHRDSKYGRSKKVKTIVDHKNGITIKPSSRFWKSLFLEYELGTPSEKFFTYFPYEEVFDRIKQKTDSPLAAICLEYVPESGNQFIGYGISRKNTQTRFDDVIAILERKQDDLKSYKFTNGVIEANYRAKDPISNFEIAGDAYNGFVQIHAPIDGLANPCTYLGAERLICTNGAIALSPVFRSQFKVAENGLKTLETIIDSYRNENGFIQLRNRFANADLSYLSMREAFKISKLFSTIMKDMPDNSKMHTAVWKFSDMLGEFAEELGISSLNQVSDKVASGIPMRPTVLSMIQLLTECSTHYLEGSDSVRVNTFVGGLISNNYDLELSKSQMGEYDAFLARK
ncbi:MAG: hypothetical protein WC358_03525 [Ignavibacteria bacterium]|jgi:hypothetical protein